MAPPRGGRRHSRGTVQLQRRKVLGSISVCQSLRSGVLRGHFLAIIQDIALIQTLFLQPSAPTEQPFGIPEARLNISQEQCMGAQELWARQDGWDTHEGGPT